MAKKETALQRLGLRAVEKPHGYRFIPFGGESRCREVLDLSPAELCAVVCLIAAEACGTGLVTIATLEEKTGLDLNNRLSSLARRLWVESPEKVSRSRERLWRATPHAWRRLGFHGWQVVLFTKEAIEQGLHLRDIANDVYLEHLRKCAARGEVIDVEGVEVAPAALPAVAS